MPALADCSLSPGDLQQICVAMGPVIKQAVDEELLSRRAKPKPQKPTEADMIGTPKMKSDSSPAGIEKAKQYAKQAESKRNLEMFEVASEVAQAAHLAARKNGQNLNISAEVSRLMAEYRTQPIRYEKDKAATRQTRERYYRPTDAREKQDNVQPGNTRGYIAPIQAINAIAQKRFEEKRQRGERADLSQERLKSRDETFDAVTRQLNGSRGGKIGNSPIPLDEAREFYAATQSITTRAADEAAANVQRARSRGENLDFAGELRRCIERLANERNENLWQAIR